MSNSPQTSYNYKSACSSFWDFLALIGDYEFMIIMLPHPPNGSPSIKLDSIGYFVLYKFNPLIESLEIDDFSVCTYDFNLHNLDSTLHNPKLTDLLCCVGITKNPNSFKNYHSALTMLHVKNGQNGSCIKKCFNCYLNFTNDDNFLEDACCHRLYYLFCCSSGNPCKSFLVGDTKKFVSNQAVLRGYKEKARDPLLPSDVYDFHQFLNSSQYNHRNLTWYTTALFAIKYGLHYVGFSGLMFPSFENYNNM